MKVTILGCYSATPRTLNNPTSQVLEINNRIFLIDCGEGTQVQLRKHKIKFSRIKHVFISHLHGDHFFGLPGLVSTFQMLGRDTELHIYGPKGIKEAVLLYLKLGNSYTSYPLIFHELTSTEQEVVLDDEKVTVSTIPLKHRVYTNGYLFEEKPKERKLDVNAVLNFEIDKCYYQNIKNGKDVVLDDGSVISNDRLTFDPPPSKSYAFCSDTIYKPDIVPLIKGVTAVYHESTFLNKHQHLCDHTKHSTAYQAGLIAKEANVKNLILGHYSTRYDNITDFKKEALTVFDTVHLAEDGKVFEF
ncbi:ribonuclease Z [Neptunitalea lumnitzerae]|uniref:Ribonuclease Z n=1 Tax=Neptunitalea lumnitzerae TaxID=2965509 RepID=A0ABQ5ML71_9FLAO|nr:ribonuclease Z [Neptunitalea sp. Y10]GLB50144.1 ribonuclease Z [Neptunitalea sp. Y10]